MLVRVDAPRRRRLQLAIVVGGCVGTLARAGLVELLPGDGRSWPWATFAANMAGSCLLGYVTTWLPRSAFRRPLLGTGFCGALTTFSTLQVELIELARAGHVALAAAYLAASVCGGLALVRLGRKAARRAVPA
jgi:CrcB protein